MLRPAIMMLLFSFCLLPALAQTGANAQVIRMSSSLNLRAEPARDASVVAELSGGTPLSILGRSRDNAWYQVRTQEGIVGWASSGYIETDADPASLPIIGLDVAAAPSEQSESPAAEAAPPAEDEAMARVAPDVQLNARSTPSTRGSVLQGLRPNTPLTLTGRNADSSWLQISLGDQTAWVATAYVRTTLDLASLPLIETASAVAAATGPISIPYFELGSGTGSIFQRGQALGRRTVAFSKIGDSITVEAMMYRPVGSGPVRLGDYAYLQPVLDLYLPVNVRQGNAFSNVSLAAGNGWTTATLLDPSFANGSLCRPGETPLACEYRVVNPAIALIMIGSNDLVALSPDQYRANLQQIIVYTIEQGIVPALSTIPTRMLQEGRSAELNQIIVDTARSNGIPLWDYAAAMNALPDLGLSADGLHPSVHPGGFGYAADFTGDHLKYGYVLRNLMALQTLYGILTQMQAL